MFSFRYPIPVTYLLSVGGRKAATPPGDALMSACAAWREPAHVPSYACQISSRYSRMVRSDENQPDEAVLWSARRFQLSLSA